MNVAIQRTCRTEQLIRDMRVATRHDMAGTGTLVSLWHGLSQQVVLNCRDGR